MHASLAPLLAKYMLSIFLTTKTTIYPNSIKKFYAHFFAKNNFIFSFVNHTLMVVNLEILIAEFGMDASVQCWMKNLSYTTTRSKQSDLFFPMIFHQISIEICCLLGIFLTTKTIVYPNLVNKFYAYFSVKNNFISNFVNCTLMTMNLEILVVEFSVDASHPKLDAKSFPHYNKKQVIRLIFPYDIPLDIYRNLLSTSLPPKDKILHLTLSKVILPTITNLNHIIDKELDH